MEKEAKPDIRTQYQVADGKIVALQADPECKEMNRLVADVNRCVLRVQSHGQPSQEKARGEYRGVGVEVAREAADEEEPAAGSGGPFYSDADEPEQRSGSALVEQYLEDVEQVEGKPGPVKRTFRQWLYGKPASKAESCCCRQVGAVSGKTIAEASGMRDEAVDRLLVNVYFEPTPERDVASRVFRRASEVSKRVSERVKSAARRLSRRYTEYRAGSSSSTRGDVAPEADTVQLRQRPAGQPRAGSDEERFHSALEGDARASSEEERFHSALEGEARASSDEERFHSARSSGEAAGPAPQSGHNVGVYQVLLEGEAEDADDSGPNYQWPPPHHETITEGDWETKGMRTNTANTRINSERGTSNSERSDQCICIHEKLKSPDRDCSAIKDSGTDRTRIKSEEREQQIEASEPNVDLQLSESDRHQNRGGQRRIVGNVDLYILNNSSEFDWEPVPENSEELSLASQAIGGEEFEEDSLKSNEDNKSSSAHSQIENQFRDARTVETSDEPECIEQSIQNVEQQETVQPRRQQDSIPTVEHEVAVDSERVEENTQNVDNGRRSTRTVKENRKSI